MKILLFLNGKEGCQTGIEDGFTYILNSKKISKLDWFYYNDYSNKNSEKAACNKMIELAYKLTPDIIVFFHIGNFNLDLHFFKKLRNISSKPKLVYDEGDMYGSWAKPILKKMKLMFQNVDVISIRGLGKFHDKIQKLNPNIIYTPHHNDIARFDVEPPKDEKRESNLVLIGNKVKPKILSSIRRLPGARQREQFVKVMGKEFPKQLKLYGNGWNNFIGNQGPVDFYKQNEIYQKNWITIAYEHYPKIPFYFSNRLPMALMNGSLYVCHYHKGYEKMFPNCDFIFFFNSYRESIDIIKYLLSLSEEELSKRSKNAKEFALRQYHPSIIWSNFLTNTLKNIELQSIK